MLGSYPLQVQIPASDPARARGFYETVVGARVVRDLADLGIILTSGGTDFAIYPTPSGGQAEHTLAEWLVDDLDAELTRLRQHGVTIENYDLPGLKTVNGVAHLGPVKASWIRDSEGNILAVGQWVEPPMQ